MEDYSDVKDDRQDKDVKAALRVIDNYSDQRNEHDTIVDTIQALLNEGFTIQEPTGAKRLSGQLLFQALWRTASRMKPVDFTVHGSGADQNLEKIVRDAINTVMDRGEYDACLRGKNGAFYDLLLYGDALIQVGANEESKFPILFSNTTLKNVYVNTSATGVRVHQRGRSARKIVLIFFYTKEEFGEIWPKFKNKVRCGKIQREASTKAQQMTWNQDGKEKDEEIEVAFSYDLDTRTYLVFAGSSHTILEKQKGERYPFVLNGKPYIPLLHLVCIPSNEGFWNIGIGHILYRLTIVSRQLMNMGTTHVLNNILPIELVSIAQGKSAAFFQGLKKASQMQAQGKRGFVPMERSSGDPNSAAVSSQTLTSQSLFNEWTALYDRLTSEVRRLGINIDEMDATGNKTATEIIALEENSNAFVKLIGSFNASEYQFAAELTMNMIKELVGAKDKTPLDLTTKITLEASGREKRIGDVTLGAVAEMLNSRRWFIRVDDKTSGAIFTNTMKFARYNALSPFAQPGTPLGDSIIQGMVEFYELDLPVGQQTQAGPAPEGQLQVEAAATERQEINPNVAVRGPAI